MDIIKDLISCNYEKRENRKINYIVLHYTTSRDSKKGSAKNSRDWFNNPEAQSSAHYCIDDSTIIQCVEESNKAWHCGTKGQYKHPECRNENSIGIEMASNHADKKTKSIPSEDPGWFITEETRHNAVKLTAYLMQKYNIPIYNVIRHFDVTGKDCPSPYVDSNKEGWTGWERFISEVKQELEEDKMFNSVEECPAWSQEAIKFFVDNKYLQGDNNGNLNLTYDMIRLLVIMYRMKEGV